MTKYLICGSRNINMNYTDFYNYISNLQITNEDTIIEGCCPNSPDILAEEYAKNKNIPIKHYPGAPGKYLKRDREMIDECDVVIAFWNTKSKGTKYTIDYAKKQDKKILLFTII